ncbi:MAG TPA: hypothetical protein VIV06_02180 [Candidatus Limnocylindrales bacterium]
MAIAWTPDRETGAPTFDGECRELIGRLNGLVSTVAAGADRALVERSLRVVGDRAVRHFSRDEDCSMKARCPALEDNGLARAELIAILARFRTDYERGGERSAMAGGLEQALVAWVDRYLPGPDPAGRPCVAAGL